MSDSEWNPRSGPTKCPDPEGVEQGSRSVALFQGAITLDGVYTEFRSAPPQAMVFVAFSDPDYLCMDKDRESSLLPLVFTLLGSVVAGSLFGLWANQLDPDGSGASVRIFPIPVVLIMLCFAVFATGIVCHKDAFGPYLMVASVLIFVVFFISRPFLRSIF